jgi:hypothetical protein
MTVLRGLPFVALLVGALFAFGPQASVPVDNGTFVGTVTDSSSVRIPGAKVTVREESTWARTR